MQLAEPLPFRTATWQSLLSLILLVFACMVLSQFIAFFILKVAYGLPLEELEYMVSAPAQWGNAHQARSALLFLQIMTAAGGFFGGSFLYWYGVERLQRKHWCADDAANQSMHWALVALLLIVLLPTISFLEYWNHRLPMGEWAVQKEQELAALTKLLVGFEGPGQSLMGFLAIVLLPAVGEELLFRGVLQNRLLAWLRNPHVAIWTAAFVFSVVHFQFLGLLPRWILGALLGYIYYWSGNLLLAMWGHFVNNGVALLLMRFQQRFFPELAPDAVQHVHWGVLLLSLVATGVTLYWFVAVTLPLREKRTSKRDF
ncbi:CPBP family intramembrane glutamic endopeptidase [Thermonema rossianum]|uniref:CPBP family intramembrane glutamic endopeptidase n=1 Tax=Thermonema rossianum TaxID=55505 RepID=UPI00068EB54F|nr:CPBP family intramembrane glutamic endopeptidase [Thermonema rossianum]